MSTHRARRRLILPLAVALALVTGPAALAKGGGAGGGGSAPAPSLQSDWPAAVPLPVGTITGTSGTAPSETVGLVAESSYPDVVRSVTALYVSSGFTQAGDGTLVFANASYRVTVGGAARDHSPTRTNVVVWLQTL